MDRMEILRGFAAITTIAGSILVAANWSPRLIVLGFMIFVAASLAWLVDGWLESKMSLIIQNIILLLVNIGGIYRWMPRD